MVAIDTEFDNFQFSQDQNAIESVFQIMSEGDKILRAMNIPITQDVQSRITQTLSSTQHTMSMLHDYKNGRQVELEFLWDGFDKISSILKIELPYSKEIYEKVMTKIQAIGSSNTS